MPTDPEKHVLVIEDDADDAYIIAELLREMGITADVLVESHLAELALDRIQVPIMVLLDLRMPNVDGYAICMLLREHPRFADVPVIAYSSYHEQMPEARRQGFDGFIGKPLDPPKFYKQVEKLLLGEAVWEP
nr:response regulator [Anaerolineae bacterium]